MCALDKNEGLAGEVKTLKAKIGGLEHALKESEHKYSVMLDTSPDGIVMIDLETHRPRYVNPAFCVMMGYEDKELKTLSVKDFHPEDRRKECMAIFERAVKGELETVGDVPILRKDGTVIYTEISVSGRVFTEGRECMIGIFRDTTERCITEEDLKESERKWYSLAENAPSLVIIADREGKISYINRGVEGVGTREKTMKRSIYDYITPEYHEIARERIEHVFKTGETASYENRVKGPGKKEYFWYDTQIGPIKKGDNVVNVTLFATDITERRVAEEDAQKQKELLEKLISTAPHYIFWKDINSVYLGCNDNFAKVAGIKKAGDIVGKTDYDLAWKKEESDFFRKIDRDVMDKAKPMVDIEEPQLQADGKEAILLTSKVPLQDHEGKVFGILGMYSDITERKKMEDFLRESELLYRTLFENTGTAMILLEGDMTISMVNTEFEKMMGYKKELTEERKKITDYVVKGYVDKVKKYHELRRIDPDAVPRNYEIQVMHENQDIVDVYLTVALIPGTERTVVSFLDITEMKKSAFELERQKELLDNTNKALEHKLYELREATGHIKKLEGLVPICASCKKMMMEGQNPKDTKAWIPLEKYISDRTDASFTHGLCPECVKKMYGEMGKRKE